MNKKGQGLTLQTVVIAALVVLVLLVLALYFSGGILRFGRSLGNCQVNGGACLESKDCKTTENHFDASGNEFSGCSGQTRCCIKQSVYDSLKATTTTTQP